MILIQFNIKWYIQYIPEDKIRCEGADALWSIIKYYGPVDMITSLGNKVFDKIFEIVLLHRWILN